MLSYIHGVINPWVLFFFCLSEDLFVPGMLSALRALHISGSVHVHCEENPREGRHVSVLTFSALVITGCLLYSECKDDSYHAYGK